MSIRSKVITGAVVSELAILGVYANDFVDVETASKITLGVGTVIVGTYVLDALSEPLKNIAGDIRRYIKPLA